MFSKLFRRRGGGGEAEPPAGGGPRRREHERIPATVPLRARCSSWSSFRDLFSGNVSRRGLFVPSEELAELGETIQLELVAPDGQPLQLAGEVVHVFEGSPGKPRGLGVQLRAPGPEQDRLYQTLLEEAARQVKVKPAPEELAHPGVPAAAPGALFGQAPAATATSLAAVPGPDATGSGAADHDIFAAPLGSDDRARDRPRGSDEDNLFAFAARSDAAGHDIFAPPAPEPPPPARPPARSSSGEAAMASAQAQTRGGVPAVPGVAAAASRRAEGPAPGPADDEGVSIIPPLEAGPSQRSRIRTPSRLAPSRALDGKQDAAAAEPSPEAVRLEDEAVVVTSRPDHGFGAARPVGAGEYHLFTSPSAPAAREAPSPEPIPPLAPATVTTPRDLHLQLDDDDEVMVVSLPDSQDQPPLVIQQATAPSEEIPIFMENEPAAFSAPGRPLPPPWPSPGQPGSPPAPTTTSQQSSTSAGLRAALSLPARSPTAQSLAAVATSPADAATATSLPAVRRPVPPAPATGLTPALPPAVPAVPAVPGSPASPSRATPPHHQATPPRPAAAPRVAPPPTPAARPAPPAIPPPLPRSAPAGSSQAAPVVAIDFGTSMSCLAMVRGAEVHVLRTPCGRRDIPSVVGFAGGKILVGTQARELLLASPPNAIASPKRLLGRRYDDRELEPFLTTLAMPHSRARNGEVQLHPPGGKLSVAEACTPILTYLRRLAEQELQQPVEQVVLTVPVSFDERRCQALREAARLAGLEVLSTVDEPTAAALTYSADPSYRGLVAVYDFGGGTFDFSVVDVSSADVQVVATAGDTWLGGDDLDEALAGTAANAFWRQHGIELRHQAVQWQRLRLAAERAKRELSMREQAVVELREAALTARGPLDLRFPVTRQSFAELSADIIQRSLDTCQEALALCDIKTSELSAVYLSGGTCYVPSVREAVSRYFGRPAKVTVPPERAVVMGAAMYAVKQLSARISY